MAGVSHILCPTDFSEGARLALIHAAALARHTGAHLTVAHAWSPGPLTVLGYSTAPAVSPEEREAVVERLNSSVQAFRAQGVRLATVALEGAPVAALLSYIGEAGVDLVVMGTHGRTGFERLVLGSVTEKLLRKATCPVLTIPATISGGEPSFARLLCAVDHVGAKDPSVALALWLASRDHGEVTLLHAVEPLHPPPGLGDFDASAYTDRVSQDWLAALRDSVDAETRAARHVHERVAVGKPGRVIVETATQSGADIIVMGVHGRGALDLLLLGSTTHYVVRHAHCPVLTVRLSD